MDGTSLCGNYYIIPYFSHQKISIVPTYRFLIFPIILWGYYFWFEDTIYYAPLINSIIIKMLTFQDSFRTHRIIANNLSLLSFLFDRLLWGIWKPIKIKWPYRLCNHWLSPVVLLNCFEINEQQSNMDLFYLHTCCLNYVSKSMTRERREIGKSERTRVNLGKAY